jgi:hypothetical protein
MTTENDTQNFDDLSVDGLSAWLEKKGIPAEFCKTLKGTCSN